MIQIKTLMKIKNKFIDDVFWLQHNTEAGLIMRLRDGKTDEAYFVHFQVKGAAVDVIQKWDPVSYHKLYKAASLISDHDSIEYEKIASDENLRKKYEEFIYLKNIFEHLPTDA